MTQIKQVGGTHYQQGYQHWDLVLDTATPYCLATATKYLSRLGKKDKVYKDLDKAISYLVKMVNHVLDTGCIELVVCKGYSAHLDEFLTSKVEAESTEESHQRLEVLTRANVFIRRLYDVFYSESNRHDSTVFSVSEFRMVPTRVLSTQVMDMTDLMSFINQIDLIVYELRHWSATEALNEAKAVLAAASMSSSCGEPTSAYVNQDRGSTSSGA